jgi:hypothetical protein
MRNGSERKATGSFGKPANGTEYEIMMRAIMQRRQWLVFRSHAGDKRRATDHIIRRIALRRRLNHVVLFAQTTIRHRDLKKVSATLEIWEGVRKKKNPLAAWVFVEFDASSWDPRAMIEAAIIEMENRFSREPPLRGRMYCLLVDARGRCEWKDPFRYRRELADRRRADLAGPRNEGAISMVNHSGITVCDRADGQKYFVFWNEILDPEDGSPQPPLTVGSRVTFVPDGRMAGRAPLARCVLIEARAAA